MALMTEELSRNNMDVIIRCAVKIYEMNQAPVVITMGRKGLCGMKEMIFIW